jgi:hypothetical protein
VCGHGNDEASGFCTERNARGTVKPAHSTATFAIVCCLLFESLKGWKLWAREQWPVKHTMHLGILKCKLITNNSQNLQTKCRRKVPLISFLEINVTSASLVKWATTRSEGTAVRCRGVSGAIRILTSNFFHYINTLWLLHMSVVIPSVKF